MVEMMGTEEGGIAPVVRCDVCGASITIAGGAAVVSARLIAEGQFAKLLYAHKGQCQDQAEASLGGKLETGWMELTTHMLHLVHNVGLKPADLAKHETALNNVGLI